MSSKVITTHLEMLSLEALRLASKPARFTLGRVEQPNPAFARFLYTAAGADWMWYSRLDWDYARWWKHLNRPELELWVAYENGSPIGFFELEAQSAGNMEILYFGLLPEALGGGHGGALLEAAVRRAWAAGARRLWVHTCDLDHEHALANYRARGFTVFKVEEGWEDLPGDMDLWPGARRPRNH